MNSHALLILLSLVFYSCNDSGAAESVKEVSPPSKNKAREKTPEVPNTKEKESQTAPKNDVDEVLENLQKALTFNKQRAIKTKSWLSWQKVAGIYLGHARISGDVNSFVKAGHAIDEAFKIAKPGAGPFLTRAGYNLTIHKISEVEADLVAFEKKIVIKTSERAKVAALRGAVFFLSGDLPKALEHFKKAESLKADTSSASRLANYYLKTGDYDLARTWYKKAIERVDKSDKNTHAWAELHLGIVNLEENNLPEAEKHYAIANELFTGWYLINEHIAEAARLTKDYGPAIDRYKQILKKTPNGEFYQALGDTYLASGVEGKKAKAQKAYADARAAFERDIAILPSAASGHALNFYLKHAVVRALDLARENFKLRPGHEARTQLAMALLLNGKKEKARQILKPTLSSKWGKHDYLLLGAYLFEKENPKAAKKLRKRAEKTHPGSYTDFVESLPKS